MTYFDTFGITRDESINKWVARFIAFGEIQEVVGKSPTEVIDLADRFATYHLEGF